ncbi:hypothetical protein MRB53_007005 [Persea americana]|uniref:Uncharacterized protein n=1 Tax=Persea americana TaxID=3435 RepID=A0ACC2MJD5_PERAE|nr:hypothetical protein MRB53_007005 [Persea americana]
MQIFQSTRRKSVEHWTAMIIGEITFIGVLNACSHAGLVKEGAMYFELMEKVYKIIQHYACLVDLYCRGYLDEAKNVVEKMPVDPNMVIWLMLLSGATCHGNVAMAEFAAQKPGEMGSLADGYF